MISNGSKVPDVLQDNLLDMQWIWMDFFPMVQQFTVLQALCVVRMEKGKKMLTVREKHDQKTGDRPPGEYAQRIGERDDSVRGTLFFRCPHGEWSESWPFLYRTQDRWPVIWDKLNLSIRKHLTDGTTIVAMIRPGETEKVAFNPPLGRLP
jgi:hypothetical protein